jgi:hypothetical protein
MMVKMVISRGDGDGIYMKLIMGMKQFIQTV